MDVIAGHSSMYLSCRKCQQHSRKDLPVLLSALLPLSPSPSSLPLVGL